MKNENSLLAQLIESFNILPGIGEKSAQRMAFYLLEKNREGGVNLAKLISSSMEQIRNCASCRTLTEEKVCDICSSEKREKILLCVVENPTDIIAIESSGSFKGKYFVLMGRLSPIDGIGPEDIGIDDLLKLIESKSVKEIILATSSTVEGDATAIYIKDHVKTAKVSRISYGIPIGGELEYVDGTTIARAIEGRIEVNVD